MHIHTVHAIRIKVSLLVDNTHGDTKFAHVNTVTWRTMHAIRMHVLLVLNIYILIIVVSFAYEIGVYDLLQGGKGKHVYCMYCMCVHVCTAISD